MVVMYKVNKEKKEKMVKKLDKMIDFIEEFIDCLEESEEYDDDEWEDAPKYRKSSNSGVSMRSRYSRK